MHPDRPGWPTRTTSRLLGWLRDGGQPFLRGADDAKLRTFALGMRAALRRTLAGPLPRQALAPAQSTPFATLGPSDQVRVMTDNAAAFEAKCTALEGATRTIDCALFYLADDATGRQFAGALERAVKRGVTVRLCADAFASVEKQYGPFGYGVPRAQGALALAETLRGHGCEVQLLGTDHWCMHRKFLFVDGATLILGGRNVADHYAEPGWRDLELLLQGPFAESFRAVVDATFLTPEAAPRPAPGVVCGVPGAGGEAFERAASTLVDEAQATVDIEHAYLLSQPWLMARLGAAVRRGVRVRAFTNGPESNDLPFMNWRLALSLRELTRLGVQVFRRTSVHTVHTKLLLADRRRILFGSTNLDYYSPTYCAELDLAVHSPTLGAELSTVLEAGLLAPETEVIAPGSGAEAALARECEAWSVARFFDYLLHDIQ